MSVFFSRILSVILHPLLMVTYSFVLLVAIKPYEFGATSITDKSATVMLLGVFSISFLLPAVAIALMKPLGFIESLEMKTKQERTLPYIAAGVFYLWTYVNLSHNSMTPLFNQFVLGATIGLFAVFFCNIFTKISAHAAGMGGMVGGVFAVMTTWGTGSLTIPFFGGMVAVSMNYVLIVALFLAGLIGTVRMVIKSHSLEQVTLGYAVGLAAQMVASFIV